MDLKVKRCLKVVFYPLWLLYRKVRPYLRKIQNPKKVADKLYYYSFGRHINWEKPTELNEKIRWLQFNTDISIWSKLADKYLVREYVKEKGFENILTPLYAVWEKADDIDFTKLPDDFVIKTNHGSGHVFVIQNKSKYNLEKIRKELKVFLRMPYGYDTVETHYYGISRCILAEKMLLNDLKCSSTIADYKFYCFKGEPLICGVFYDRDVRKNVSFYDMQWIRRDEFRSDKMKGIQQKDIPMPNTFEQMKRACKILSSDFPFVRMDFYESEGRLYFGEFTFTPAALTGGSLSMFALEKMGKIIELPEKVK